MRRITRRTCHRLANGLLLTQTVWLAVLLMLTLTGCAGQHRTDSATATGVQLSHANYQLIKPGAHEGRAVALTNLSEDSYTVHFLLFAIPRLRVSADVIEFTDTSAGSSSQLRAIDPNAPVPCREVGDQLVCDTPVR